MSNAMDNVRGNGCIVPESLISTISLSGQFYALNTLIKRKESFPIDKEARRYPEPAWSL